MAARFLRGHDANFGDRPPNSGAEHVAYNYRDLVFAPYGARWRALRKLLALHLFSAKAIDALRGVRELEVALMVKGLRVSSSAPAGVAVGQEANVCATNALARAAVGRRVFFSGGGGGADSREFKEMVVELMQLAGVFNLGDFIPALRWLDPQGVVAKMKKLHRRYDDMMNGFIKERDAGAGAEQGKDLLSVMLGKMRELGGDDNNGGEEGEFTEVDIKALLLNLFTAGTDTTSSTVEWALAELIRHPDVLRQLQQELDAVVGKDRLVSESDLPRLAFLAAVIKETFRLHPSTPLSLPRLAAEECEVDGYRIPKGTTLLVNVWAIARDPASWADPLEFRPARFLPGGSHEGVDVKGGDYELIPFGAGRRICAGLSWGLRMVTLMTATLVHGFDWALVNGMTPDKLDMEEAYGLTLQRAVPLMVQPVPRLLPSAYAVQCDG